MGSSWQPIPVIASAPWHVFDLLFYLNLQGLFLIKWESCLPSFLWIGIATYLRKSGIKETNHEFLTSLLITSLIIKGFFLHNGTSIPMHTPSVSSHWALILGKSKPEPNLLPPLLDIRANCGWRKFSICLQVDRELKFWFRSRSHQNICVSHLSDAMAALYFISSFFLGNHQR